MVVEDLAEPRGEAVALEEVRHAHGAPRHLVLVGGADAAARGADRVRAARALARAVERDVRRQDQRAVRADAQPLVDRRRRVCTSASASRNSASSDSTTPLPIRQRTPGCRMPDGISDSTVFAPSMTSVCPALWPPWKRTTAADALGQQVDDLALAFVAPLGTDDDEVLCHAGECRLELSACSGSAAHEIEQHGPAIMLASPTARSVPVVDPRQHRAACASCRPGSRTASGPRARGTGRTPPTGRSSAWTPAAGSRVSAPESFRYLKNSPSGCDHQHVALLAERAAVGLQAAVERVELRIAAVGLRIDVRGERVAVALMISAWR